MRTGEIAEFLHGELIGDGRVEIVAVASVDSASVGEITFTEKKDATETNASCVLVPPDFDPKTEPAQLPTS